MQFSYASKKLEGSGITQSHYRGKHDVTSGKLAQHFSTALSISEKFHYYVTWHLLWTKEI